MTYDVVTIRREEVGKHPLIVTATDTVAIVLAVGDGSVVFSVHKRYVDDMSSIMLGRNKGINFSAKEFAIKSYDKGSWVHMEIYHEPETRVYIKQHVDMISNDWNADIDTERIKMVYGFKTKRAVYAYVNSKKRQGYPFKDRKPGRQKKLTQSEEITAGAIRQGG